MCFISSLGLLDRHRLCLPMMSNSFHLQRSVRSFDCIVNALPRFFQYSFFADDNNEFYEGAKTSSAEALIGGFHLTSRGPCFYKEQCCQMSFQLGT